MDYTAAIDSAKELVQIWGDDIDEIDAHLESEGFSGAEIRVALDHIDPLRPRLLYAVMVPPA